MRASSSVIRRAQPGRSRASMARPVSPVRTPCVLPSPLLSERSWGVWRRQKRIRPSRAASATSRLMSISNKSHRSEPHLVLPSASSEILLAKQRRAGKYLSLVCSVIARMSLAFAVRSLAMSYRACSFCWPFRATRRSSSRFRSSCFLTSSSAAGSGWRSEWSFVSSCGLPLTTRNMRSRPFRGRLRFSTLLMQPSARQGDHRLARSCQCRQGTCRNLQASA